VHIRTGTQEKYLLIHAEYASIMVEIQYDSYSQSQSLFLFAGFAKKLRKETIIFVVSVRPYARMEELYSTEPQTFLLLTLTSANLTENDHSPPSGAEVKNKSIYNFTPPVYIHCTYRDYFILPSLFEIYDSFSHV
jgi:hypothetical protein